MKIARINLKDVICHPSIDELYLLSKDVDSEKIYAELSDEMLIFIQNNKPLHVIKHDKKQYYFFSNWDILVELKSRGIRKITAILHDKKATDEFISEWAYQSEITKWIPSLKDRPQFKYLQKLIELSPPLTQKMFKDGNTKLAVSSIQKLANLTRSQVRSKIDSKDKEGTKLEQFLRESNESKS